jgi:predicted enzyme related to lactoylglutathione lyase
VQLLINIDVPDVAQAERFYTAAFGLRPSRRFGEDGLELLGAGVPVYLLRKAAGTQAAGAAVRDYARHWSPVHCDVAVDDIEAALERAVQAGARQEGGLRTAGWGRIVQLADPFGHGWCLIQFSAAGYDAIAT